MSWGSPTASTDAGFNDDEDLSNLLETSQSLGRSAAQGDLGDVKRYQNQSAETKSFLAFEMDKQCYFSDGKRQPRPNVLLAQCVKSAFTQSSFLPYTEIDFVLAYEENASSDLNEETPTLLDIDLDDEDDEPDSTMTPRSAAEKKRRKRSLFELNLERMGLQLERVKIAPTLGCTRFVLIHAPFSVLERQAQLLAVKLPVQQSDLQFKYGSMLPGFVDRILAEFGLFDFDAQLKKHLEEPVFFQAPYATDRRQQFINWDRPDILFPNAERSRMVYDLLTRARYDEVILDRSMRTTTQYTFGIERLLAQRVYNAAYPLHQTRREGNTRGVEISQRELLYNHWVSWRSMTKYQPLDCIKRYFGTKVAFYFAWLGYYTRSLMLPAVMGLLTVLFGMLHMDKDETSNSICSDSYITNTTLICPQCEHCDFQPLGNSCLYAKVSYLFDNWVTVIFAALVCVWATIFLEGWKRYHAEIAWKWGLLDFVVEEDILRPEFLRVKTKQYNPVTEQEEPYLSRNKKFANICAGGVTVVFFTCLILAVVFGVVVYRVICMRLLARMDNPQIDSIAFLIVSSTAALINLIVIMIMNYFYSHLAHWLTRWECPRTQTDFDNSYTFKVFLFQFANYYSFVFYVAFFKGALVQLPGTRSNDGNVKIAGYRLEGCNPAGCFVELVIQLAIIMCGRQFFSGLVEFAYSKLMGLVRQWQFMVPIMETEGGRNRRTREKISKKARNSLNRWEADYYLNPTFDQFLFYEYLEMVLQFGFVTLFVSAFPLAPFFAVLNNIFEIRLDAYKFLILTQKPIPAQARNIGVWVNILETISKLTIPINALVIAFTSDFVPELMYFIMNHSMEGYVNSSLSYFDATLYDFKSKRFHNVTLCRYRGYRLPPCSLMPERTTVYGKDVCDDNLGFSSTWWKIFAARLLFVVIFEHLVFVIKALIDYFIPDIPSRIFVQQQREQFLMRKALLTNLFSGSVSTCGSSINGSGDGGRAGNTTNTVLFNERNLPSNDF